MFFGLFGTSANASETDRFWKWFEKNEQAFYEMDPYDEELFDQLAGQLHKIDENLAFEFSPVKPNGKREFIISANGIKDAFPAVEKLHEAAPAIERWIWIKFRPRQLPLFNIEMAGKKVDPNNVSYIMAKDEEKVGLVLFIENYNGQDERIYDHIGFLLLDQALGEYAVATQVGFIKFHSPESKYYEQSSPIRELPAHFDEYYGRSTQ